MKTFKYFLEDFKSRSGFSVFGSSIFLKLIGFLLSIFVVRLLTKNEYGYMSIALSLMSIITGISGFGGNWTLLRYGSITDSFRNKLSLFFQLLNRGLFFNLLLFFLIYIISFILNDKFIPARKYLLILGLGVFTNYCFELIKSYFRILNKNIIFSKLNVLGSVILFALAFILTFLFEGLGYVAALVVAPLITFTICFKRINKKKYIKNVSFKKEYFSYGIYTGLGVIASQTIITSSPLIASFLNIDPDQIAILRTATIIPFNLLILPGIIMTTDYVHLSKLYLNPFELKKYYFNYLKTISVVFVIPFTILLIFHKYIIVFLFGIKYVESSNMFLVLLSSIFFSFLFRVPLGNILAAIGKANWNVIHALVWFILFLPMCYFFNEIYGIDGFAYAIATVIILSGFVSYWLFMKYIKMISKN